ncbi:NAD(P)-dependent glycerol-3-phosphate dehydrogenase [Roseibium denhamense]|uniref:Glycerol-3-phosphate dehydrogenase [NAD(P)+] n=1 Tax=Roseibium denhamense TaxID=76305 RepID=A0ABY1P7P1_9HYPH|nr:NAD(P)H-dependent glycerol-3-phosphate dehydrogenase [Roseibium denhamense]MTI04453.1 NAD(P)-dependent glycerol-3-phosphate dehydrogenase [Roseibium denhamense]SMP28463.1 glycerol-3-phosphate dehydrogenase (NAD(P)+) [Roseibium denhamense]
MGAINSIGVIGGGAWGTALALTAARAGRTVCLWARDPATVSDIRARQQNPRYLPGITFDEDLNATAKLAEVADADAILLVTPAQTTRTILASLKATGLVRGPVVLCAKGIEQSSGKILSKILSEELPGIEPAVLSGPSFADDVARGLPTAVTIAANSAKTALSLCEALQSPTFRPYASIDLLGAQIGGALKNVLAIACGAVVGRKLGASAQAALTARGFAELNRLGIAMGAQGETLTGLSGLGDLVLTCSSSQSRNFSFGLRLGEGFMASELISAGGKLAEGAYSARVAVKLGRKYEVDVPICETVAQMIDEDLSIDDALTTLMARPLKAESGML